MNWSYLISLWLISLLDNSKWIISQILNLWIIISDEELNFSCDALRNLIFYNYRNYNFSFFYWNLTNTKTVKLRWKLIAFIIKLKFDINLKFAKNRNTGLFFHLNAFSNFVSSAELYYDSQSPSILRVIDFHSMKVWNSYSSVLVCKIKFDWIT